MTTGMNNYLDYLGLMFATQLVLTLYGAGLRRPFGSLETIREAPEWLRKNRIPILVLDVQDRNAARIALVLDGERHRLALTLASSDLCEPRVRRPPRPG